MPHGPAPGFRQHLLASKLINQEQLEAALAAAGDDDRALSRYLIEQGLLTSFQALQIYRGFTGFYIDKYVVVDYLGRGANCLVFKARHVILPNRYVALKTLDLRDLHQDEEALKRFRSEVAILTRLDHPNIVRGYDFLEKRSRLYLVLEYVDGLDLGKLVDRLGPLPVPQAVAYAVQAGTGLAYAHRRGVIHRDIKPANLLLSREGVIKLADLGLARCLATDPNSDAPGKGLCLGTPEYMAPEQAENAEDANPRSDLYSLGATLYNLLTAEAPVKGGSYFNRLKHLLTTPPKPLAESRPDVPKELAAIVDRLRARNPADRPGSAEEAIALLQPFAEKPRPGDPQAWEAQHKASVVLEVLRGATTVAEACARYSIAEGEFERWRRAFLAAGVKALLPDAPAPDIFDDRLHELYAKIGAQAMEIEILRGHSNSQITRCAD
jgi:eukaryotic-like serine/threonine-protein kinase